jgi:hypothetical protein
MSLIYQALKQTEQQAAPSQQSGRRWTGVAPPAPAPVAYKHLTLPPKRIV